MKNYLPYFSFTIPVFLLVLLGMSIPATVGAQGLLHRPETRAIIVGISDYQNISDLDYAHRDAEVFSEYLQSDAGGNVPEENIKILLNEEATQMQLAMALDWLQEESKAGDIAYIYFSGHGDVEKKTARQRGFLLTYDAPTTTYMAGGAFPIVYLEDIIYTLSTEQDVQVILVADACRAGKLAGNSIGGNHATAGVLAKSIQNEVRILSCQPEQLSQESDNLGGGRGVFSYYLIEGLIGLANESPDEEVNVMELNQYLQKKVSTATNWEQIPKVDGPPAKRLATIDAASLEALRKKKMTESEGEGLGIVAMKSGGLKSLDPDSLIWHLYLDFKKALDQKHLLFPSEGSAYAIYEQIKDEDIIAPYRSDMKRKLAIALHDDAQQAINDYLRASPQEIRRRWNQDERYGQYPEYLGKAAELLGPKHYMYEDLKTRELYFEGLSLRLQAEPDKNEDLFRQALRMQEQAIEKDPSAAYAYNELGLLHRRLELKEKATTFFYHANEYSPNWVLPMANLITNYTELGKLDSALAVGERAISADSSFALTYHNLGYTHERAKRWTEAITKYKKAIELDPEYANSYYNLGYAYSKVKQLDKTEYYFKKYIQHAPEKEKAAAWCDLGIVAGLRNKYDTAVTYFHKAQETDPDYAKTYLKWGDLEAKNNHLKKAEAAYLEYVQRMPKRAEGHYKLAAMLAGQGKKEDALTRLELAVEKGFKDVEMLENDPMFAGLQKMKQFKKLKGALKEKSSNKK